MSSNDISGLIIVGVVDLIIIVIGIALLCGKGSFLIAGYNTMSKEEKEKYDSIKLSKFMGKIMISLALVLPCFVLGSVYEISWLLMVAIIAYLGIIIFAIVYANTKKRFKK